MLFHPFHPLILFCYSISSVHINDILSNTFVYLFVGTKYILFLFVIIETHRAAEAASKAAMSSMIAVETGEAETAAEAAMEYQNAALAATEMIQKELSKTLERKEKLQSYGVVVETLNGRDPIDVMEHLGKRNGYGSVVWRAGCWGQRGVQSILTGAFQCVSAHLAVDANGGKFWQQMLAERAVQGACGPESRVKVFSSDDDISLEFCDSNDADYACILTKEGKPVRHVRLDCR
jgi:hypothetical protein